MAVIRNEKHTVAEKSGTISIQQINDIAAIVVICIVIAFTNSEYITWLAQILFYIITFINAYLSKRKINVYCLWAILFYVFCIISGIWAYSDAGTSSIRTTLIKTMLLAICVMFYADSEREINIVLKSFIAGVTIIALKLIIYTPIIQWGTERLGSDIGINQNTIGAIFVYASAICLHYAKKFNLYFIGFLAFGTVALFSGSRKAFILLLLIIILFFFNKIKKPGNIFLYGIPFGALIFAIIYLSMTNPALYNVLGHRIEGLLNLISGQGEVDHSTIVRMDLIDIGINQFKEKVFIGYGCNSFRYMNKYNFYAHNNYIELLVNYGIIGTALYYIMPLSILVKSCIIWITKTRQIFIALIFIIIVLVSDFGMVSYYNVLTLILLTVAYRIIMISDKKQSKIMAV